MWWSLFFSLVQILVVLILLHFLKILLLLSHVFIFLIKELLTWKETTSVTVIVPILTNFFSSQTSIGRDVIVQFSTETVVLGLVDSGHAAVLAVGDHHAVLETAAESLINLSIELVSDMLIRSSIENLNNSDRVGCQMSEVSVVERVAELVGAHHRVDVDRPVQTPLVNSEQLLRLWAQIMKNWIGTLTFNLCS